MMPAMSQQLSALSAVSEPTKNMGHAKRKHSLLEQASVFTKHSTVLEKIRNEN